MSGDHPNYNIFEIDQKTKKSPEDLRGTCCHSNSSEKPLANHGGKNCQRSKIIIIIIIIIVNKNEETEMGRKTTV